MPNGNTLTCLGPSGKFIEITSSGQSVWTYINPVTATGILNQGQTPTNNLVFKIYRYAPDYAGLLGRALPPLGPIELGINATVVLGVEGNWNIISVPVAVSNFSTTTLFLTATSVAFGYSNGYTQQDTLANGRGYWLKFGSAQTVEMSGSYIASDTLTVEAGWNLVGSLTSPVATSDIIQIPPGNVLTQFFEYTASGYSPSSSINPGKGYWVKVNQSGQLILNPSWPGKHEE